MRNMGGIRALKFTQVVVGPLPAYIVLVTDMRSRGSAANPVEDLVDLPHGRILYWGDAKFDSKRTIDDFPGNRALRAAYDQVLDQRLAIVPPILHFSKLETGFLRFNGLCVIDRLDLTWFEDHGRPVRNYRLQLTVLYEEFVDVEWLRWRTSIHDIGELLGKGPKAWRRYQDGLIDRLQIWSRSVRSVADQVPPLGTADAGILNQLVGLSPTGFEAAVVSILRELNEVRHDVTRTRPTADGGFDFAGRFTLPPPLQYEIDFLGEAKKFARTNSVGPRYVSRLVARLGRLNMGYSSQRPISLAKRRKRCSPTATPTRLLAGADLVRMMRELGIVRANAISPAWLGAVEAEVAGPLAEVRRVAEEVPPYGDEWSEADS